MYEGQTLICQRIIEDNWLEFLGFIKKQSDEEMERQLKRMEALKEFDGPNNSVGALNTVAKEAYPSDHRYYDISLNTFWSWYITNKIG